MASGAASIIFSTWSCTGFGVAGVNMPRIIASRFFGPSEQWAQSWEAPALTLRPAAARDTDAAEAAWQDVLGMLPAWHRREITAEQHKALPLEVRRGISAVGGFQALSQATERERVFKRKDFVAAYRQQPSHAGAA